MKKEENCLRLEEIRSALAKADAERLSAGVSAQERELMDRVCVAFMLLLLVNFVKRIENHIFAVSF